jgi:D-beta-D-heptose 7-phosphate kinase/D-beta-D-heptose 1-phosphate adenosyltransferase
MTPAPSGAGTVHGAWALARLRKEIRRRRGGGARVVLTNGCFDLLHVGHVRTLEAARALGDALVLAINSDKSVRKLKGPGRPIVPAAERAEVLAALACVDYVVIFDELDPRRVVESLEPDILVKGGDWSLETVIGREEVEARGGRVVVLPDIPGMRTSHLISRVRGERTA